MVTYVHLIKSHGIEVTRLHIEIQPSCKPVMMQTSDETHISVLQHVIVACSLIGTEPGCFNTSQTIVNIIFCEV